MPRGDGTGPQGLGPMTGRGAGYCAGYDVPGYANPGFGGLGPQRGRGWGGGGRGWRRMFYATGLPGWLRFGYGPAAMSQDQEVQMLRGQADALKRQLDAISQRLGEIEGES